MVKKIIKNAIFGIVYGCFISSLIIFIGAIIVGDDFVNFTANYYIKNMIAAALVGMGFYIPSIVYENDKLSRGMQLLIHMGIGFVIYIPAAFFAEWMPVDKGIGVVISIIISIIIISLLIWFVFYMYYKNQAKAINKKLKDRKIQ